MFSLKRFHFDSQYCLRGPWICSEFSRTDDKVESNTFFKKNFGGHESLLWTTDTPVLDFWWRLLWVSKPAWAALFELGGGICVTWRVILYPNCCLSMKVYLYTLTINIYFSGFRSVKLNAQENRSFAQNRVFHKLATVH